MLPCVQRTGAHQGKRRARSTGKKKRHLTYLPSVGRSKLGLVVQHSLDFLHHLWGEFVQDLESLEVFGDLLGLGRAQNDSRHILFQAKPSKGLDQLTANAMRMPMRASGSTALYVRGS